MTEPGTVTDSGVVACEVCLALIPHYEASVVEVDDYVMYFCGIECYRVWRETNAAINPAADE